MRTDGAAGAGRQRAHASDARTEGGDLLVRALAERGVRRLFSVSGGPINSVYAAVAGAGVALHHVRHEAAAGFMADATARVTGVPGVAVVTLGPGVTNTVTAVATAQLAGVPVLVVGGQAPTTTADRGAGMSLDAVPVMAPVTKWAARVGQVERIPEYVDRAWRHMWAGRPGPVFLEIPADVLAARATPRDCRTADPVPAAVAPAALDGIARMLGAARRPVLLAGDGVRWSQAGGQMLAAVERHVLPFAPARLARGVGETHPLCLGPGYLPCNPPLARALREADCVLVAGHTFDFDLDFGDSLSPGTAVIHVDADPSVLGHNRPADLAVAGDVRSLFEGLAGVPAGERDGVWVASTCADWREHRTALAREAAAHGPGLHPLDLAERVRAAAPAGTTFVTSHGNIDFWADAHLQPQGETRYLRAGQAGALGAEIPYGVAASLARPGEPVIVFVGDGGFGYHCLELETAARSGAAPVVVVADDGKWGAIALPQRRAYGVEVEMDLPRRDWADLARALGGHGESVHTRDEVAPALRRALASGKPAVVHVAVESVESPYMRYISS